MKINMFKIPRGQQIIFGIDNMFKISITDSQSYRPDNVVNDLVGYDNINRDFLYNNFNNTSALRLEPKSEFLVPSDKFIEEFSKL